MEIVYVYPATDTPVGGIKVAYRHAQSLTKAGFNATVFHPRAPGFSCTWFDHSTLIRRHKRQHRIFDRKYRDLGAEFDASKDFLVIPEIWTPRYGENLINHGIRYAIFVQGGYLLDPEECSKDRRIQLAFKNASAVLVISEDTSNLIKLLFPELDSSKVFRVVPSIPYQPNPLQKDNLISFVARKAPHHAKMVEGILKERLPNKWSILNIVNVNEREMQNILHRSKIFLSFGELEGLSLPPLEAALSGAFVVGYTGQGGKEYFNMPLFSEVEFGNIQDFVRSTLNMVDNIESLNFPHRTVEQQIRNLRQRYSEENESRLLKIFASEVVNRAGEN